MKKIVLFFICIFSFFCMEQVAISANDHYIERALSDNGKVVIWPNRTISVYIAQSAYRGQVVAAFNTWQTSLSGLLRFNISNNPSAQIRVVFSTNLPNGNVGLTSNKTIDNKIVGSEIKLMVPKSVLANTNFVYNTALHEIGHAIGINGHSPNRGDALYPELVNYKQMLTLSSRDIQTVKWLYKVDQSVLDKHKNYLENSKIQESIAYVKKFPNSTVGWNNLGNAYVNLKQYDNAIWAYKKGIAVNPNAFALYKNLSTAYYYKGDKNSGFDAANKAYTLSNGRLEYLQHLSLFINNKNQAIIFKRCLYSYIQAHPNERKSEAIKKLRMIAY